MDRFIHVDGSHNRRSGRCELAEEPLVIKLPNGIIFRIDQIAVLDHMTFARQYMDTGKVSAKFCIAYDDELNNCENIEEWKIILFPWFNKYNEENVHGEIVDYDDSIMNGNIIIERSVVTHSSTNHFDEDYLVIHHKVTEYIENFILKHLEESSS